MPDPTTRGAPQPSDRPADRPSRALLRLSRRLSGDRLSVGDIQDRLAGAGTGILLLVLAVPALLPSPGLPVGAVFGAALALVGLQMILGRPRVGLPSAIRDRTMPGGFVRRAARWAARPLAAAERLMRGRLHPLTGETGHRLAGVAVFIMGIVIMLPIPFGNAPAAAVIVAIAMALMMRDGQTLALAYAALVAVLALVTWLTLATAHLIGAATG